MTSLEIACCSKYEITFLKNNKIAVKPWEVI